VAEVYALADAVGLRYRALILLAAFSSLRWGELVALRPDDSDLDACNVPDLRGHLRSGLFEGPSSLLSVVVRRAGGFPTIMSVQVTQDAEFCPVVDLFI
jgi:hypothetical protein